MVYRVTIRGSDGEVRPFLSYFKFENNCLKISFVWIHLMPISSTVFWFLDFYCGLDASEHTIEALILAGLDSFFPAWVNGDSWIFALQLKYQNLYLLAITESFPLEVGRVTGCYIRNIMPSLVNIMKGFVLSPMSY